MRRFRCVAAVGLVAWLVLPACAPVLALIREPDSLRAVLEFDRLQSLILNTTGLAGLASVVAVSLGCLLAWYTERQSVAGHRLLRAAMLVGVFVPMPVWAVAWQAILGGILPKLSLEPGAVAWRAWNTGLIPAAVVHGFAAVPWVVWIIGAMLRSTDRDLEDDARTLGGPRAVFRLVLLPRLRLALLLCVAFVAVQTATEIAITDAMMVRTFAEEVYTQLVGVGSGVAGSVALALPVWLLGLLLGFTLRAADVQSSQLQPVRTKPAATTVPWLGTILAWLIVAVVLLAPLLALLRTACGVQGSIRELGTQLLRVGQADGLVLVASLLWASVTGVSVAMLARVACWCAAQSKWFGLFLFTVSLVLFVMPGPILSIGLKSIINTLISMEDLLKPQIHWNLAAKLLYDQPSPLPGVWACGLRFFPVACVLLWPSVRQIPHELFEAVALDGHGSVGQWSRLIAPSTQKSFWRAAVAVTALSLGEVSASKLVAPPGYESFILRLFAQMHYGAEATVAAQCLLLLLVSGLLGVLFVFGASDPDSHRSIGSRG